MNAKLDNQSLGARIDAALAPFIEDEARLQQQIDQFHTKIQDYQARIEQVEQDLQVIRSAKVDALRQLADSDPLLKALLSETTAGSANISAKDRHPLLSP